uniref:DM domain-containing protein n=1 Tax=Panagrellus redivivus TaxID=6233 RepID=A0A7E4UP78_PANRE
MAFLRRRTSGQRASDQSTLNPRAVPVYPFSDYGYLPDFRPSLFNMMNMDPFSHFNALNAAAATAVAEKISGQLPGVNKRVYYCQRCLNHGRLEPRKNHKCECSFASCTCTKCILVEKRRVLNTQLHELEESVENAGNENSVEGISAGGDSALLEALNEEMSPFDEKGDLSGSGRIKGGWF